MKKQRVVITYGTYDLLHYGHIALLERARALGDYLIIGITSDTFDRERGKLNVFQSLSERIHAIEETGLADQIVVEEYKGQKIADILRYDVDVFTVGSDWVGKFDYLKKYCDVVYLDRTQGVSSTDLRASKKPLLKIGCIGLDYLTGRLVRDGKHVGGICIECGFDESPEVTQSFCGEHDIRACDSLDDLFASSDAVYISLSIDKHLHYICKALEHGCHVLCESPLFLSQHDADVAYKLAYSKKLVLMEAVKTRYFPAFEHLKLLLGSGVVGEVKDIDVSFSQILDNLDMTDMYQGSFYDTASYVFLPIVEFIGFDYVSAHLVGSFKDDFCLWTKCDLVFPTAAATMRVGRGIKTEGDMVITGTDGYVYVPAPWWKMEYFEVRKEDLRDTRKYYYECAGEGMRYELYEFARRIGLDFEEYMVNLEEKSVRATTKLIERFDAGDISKLGMGAYSFGGGEAVEG